MSVASPAAAPVQARRAVREEVREPVAEEVRIPQQPLRDRDRHRAEAVQRRAAARAGLGAHLALYGASMLVLAGLWLVDGLAGGNWHAWPIWPALGWGLPLAGQSCTALLPVRSA